MKAIILAGGEGTRLKPLTNNVPKPMVQVLGRPILEHILEALPKEITELLIVVGYKAEVIRDHFGFQYQDRKISYIQQDQRLGTAHALGLCRRYFSPNERFLYMVADDLHLAKALSNLLQHERGILVSKHAEPSRFGVVEVTEDNIVRGIEEKPEQPRSNLVSTGVYVLDTQIFNYPARLEVNGEYYITSQVEKMLKDYPLTAVQTDFWHPIGYPEDIALAEDLLQKRYG